MAENENIGYISTDIRHKNIDGNRNIILEGRKTEIANIIVTDIETMGPRNPLPEKGLFNIKI